MSYKKMAGQVQSKGKTNTPNDSMLAHITPREAGMLKAMGGSGHTDPDTGLLHFDDGAGPGGDDGNVSTGDMGTPNGGIGPIGSFSGPMSDDAASIMGLFSNTAPGNAPGLSVSESDESPAADMGNLSVNQSFNDTSNSNSIFGKVQNVVAQTALGKALSALGINTAFLGPVNAAIAGGKGPGQAGSAFGATAGTAIGSAMAGPPGGMLGGFLGGQVGSAFGGVDNSSMNGQGVANQGAAVGSGAMGGGNGLSDLIGGMAGMYMGNRSAGQYNSVLNSLQGLYSENSPYAQQLRQALERKDAAAGRRSQYGPREVQLQAALANQYAQTMSSPGVANMMNQRNIMQNQGLNNLLLLGNHSGAFKSLGNGVSGMMQGGGLQSLFNNGYSSNWALGPNAGPQMPDTSGTNLGGGNPSDFQFGGDYNFGG